MATIKHIASKNADYGAAERYLKFQHDEITNKPLLDKDGNYIPRDRYLIDSINCKTDTFAVECIEANLKYGKNSAKRDIKSHHYIISFDPRDSIENGLTIEKAQSLGMNFAKKYFPGHQALVCTHPDGHNHSGNIHVHIVINSLRISDTEHREYMDRPCDCKAGSKHRCTGKFMRFLREKVMEMCIDENLHQIDLLSGSRDRITDREYHAQRNGQRKLDKANALLIQEGKIPKESKFDTQKEELRQAITATLICAASPKEFIDKLEQDYGILVTEHRGRWSYLHPNRTKPIADRTLGEDYRKEYIENGIREQKYRTNNTRDIGTAVSEGKHGMDNQPEKTGFGKQPAETIIGRVRNGIDKVEERTKRLHRKPERDERRSVRSAAKCSVPESDDKRRTHEKPGRLDR